MEVRGQPRASVFETACLCGLLLCAVGSPVQELLNSPVSAFHLTAGVLGLQMSVKLLALCGF